jgi:polar amino acid transport system permease protein
VTEGGASAAATPAGRADTTPRDSERPGRIDAVPVRHPGRWVAMVVILVLTAMVISSFLTNDAWDWNFAWKVMQQKPIIDGLLKGTILGTIGAMALGIVFGIILAIMRLSPNPILRGAAFVYVWFFRAIPRLVLLVICGNIGILYSVIHFGPPFAGQISNALGGSYHNFTVWTLDTNALSSTIWIGIIGLGLSEAAYMAEIARAGITSVDRGQAEAAEALGMSRGQTMRRIILPQAMRVIVPPTGNETIAMLKDTSLFAGIPIAGELFFQAEAIGARTLRLFPTFIAATLYYLLVGSILMIGQYFLERRFGRGFGTGGRGQGGPAVPAGAVEPDPVPVIHGGRG